MVEENDKAAAGESSKSGAGIFGPLIHLVQQARNVHPAAGYLLVLLALVAVGAAIYKLVDPFAGGGGLPDLLRIILFTVLLLLFLMLLVAFFADFIAPSERQQKGVQLRRGMLLLAMVMGGGALGWQSGENCRVGEIVLGGQGCAAPAEPNKPVTNPETPPVAKLPDEKPPEVKPEPPKSVVFGGYVNNRKTAEAPISNLKARVRFTTQLFVADVTPDNIFTVELPREAIDETVYVSIRGNGFKPISANPVKIMAPDKGTENINHIWDLFPLSAPPSPPVFTSGVKIPKEYLQKLERKAILMQKK